MAGIFAVAGLLLLAVHIARPEALRRLVQADAELWAFTPWMNPERLDPESRYQRLYRQAMVVSLVGWTVINLALFVEPYVLR